MTLAEQIFYPDYFGGAWGFCPDPVDFHAFQTVNLYEDKNAYYDEGPFQRFPKLGARLPNDHILFTMDRLAGRKQFSARVADLQAKWKLSTLHSVPLTATVTPPGSGMQKAAPSIPKFPNTGCSTMT